MSVIPNMPTLFIPTLNISDGNAVLIKHGKVEKILGDPMVKAQYLSITKNFNIVDVDRSKGCGNNKEIIKSIVSMYPCYVGGGIRTIDDANEMITAGARRIVISTAAQDLISLIPKNKIILAIDIDENLNVMTHGRSYTTDVTIFDFLTKFMAKVEMISIVFHNTEGTFSGIPLEKVKQIKDHIRDYRIKLACGGGICNLDEIAALVSIDITPQFCSGFWNDCFTLGEVFYTILTLKQNNDWLKTPSGANVIPCIVQHVHGNILGFRFGTPETIKLCVDTRIATFYDKKKNSIMFQGMTSGFFHKVLSVHLNCDLSCVRIVVDPDGKHFCHLGQDSCFGYCDPAKGGMKTLQYKLANNVTNIQEINKTKIINDCNSLIKANSSKNVTDSAANVLFSLVNILTKHHVSIETVEKATLAIVPRVDVNNSQCTKLTIGLVTDICDIDTMLDYISQVFKTSISTTSHNNVYSVTGGIYDGKLRLIPIKSDDIETFINITNSIDGVILYDCVVKNYDTNLVKADMLHNGATTINIVAVSASQCDTMTDIITQHQKSQQLNIMTNFVELTMEWITSNKINANVIKVYGNPIKYMLNGLCDICVCTNVQCADYDNISMVNIMSASNMHLYVTENGLSKIC
jgi:phosphoribosylformimino-5-aminoimidazole carboxamide ribonucleotide (ProFAR) isomerase/phosphoribosyl-AMP cyclohydrolase